MQHPLHTVALASLLACAPSPSQAIGDPVEDFAFPALVNGDGRQRLSDFFGSPVLVEFWGTR